MNWIYLNNIFFLFILNLLLQVQSTRLFDVENKKKLSNGPGLPKNYVKEIRPTKGEPVIVDLTLFVVDINSINVEDMDFRVDLFICQSWTEPRIVITDDIFEDGDDYVILPSEFYEKLWQPDPYFLNSKIAEIATLTHKFSSVMLFKNKTVRYFARMHAIVACQMEFQLYPMDIQICPIYIESFSHSSQKLRLQWSHGGVIVNPELKLLQYKFGQPQLFENTNYIFEKNGRYSRLIVYFKFERQIGHHLIQTFAPSTLVVMLSWFSFWLGLDAIPGRVTLLVTSMLTLVTMFTGLKTDIPTVAYVKALDIWMAGCMIFVFASLGEFIVVKVLDLKCQQSVNYQRHLTARLSCMERNPSVWDYDSVYTSQQQTRKIRNGSRDLLQTSWIDPELLKSKITLSKKIDRYSRIIFPTLFLFFVLLYWPIVVLKKKSSK